MIGERTYDLVRDAALVRPLGPVDLKGKTAPTMVFELVGVEAPGHKRERPTLASSD